MIAKLRHKVSICSQRDIVVDGEFAYNRHVIIKTWAKIQVKAASAFSQQGASLSKDKKTHEICIRYRDDIDISVMGWVYESRRKSPPRWFKILKVTQTEESGSPYFKLECAIFERDEDAAAPKQESSCHAEGLPQGVKL